MFNISSAAARHIPSAIVLCLMLAEATFAGPSYQVIDLNFPSGTTDHRGTFANGISNGTVAGAYFDSRIHSADGHPLAWFGPNHDRVMLPQSPDEFQSVATSAWNTNLAGYSIDVENALHHALLWTNNGTTFTDLHPSTGYSTSAAYGMWGNTQVGVGDGHALLWHGSAGSVVDLNGNSIGSEAHGAFEDHQVGMASNHAALWSGSADSLLDLNPAGYTESFALGIWGDHQVGWADIHTGGAGDTLQHAVLWNSTADSAVFLNDSGFDSSQATAINANGDIVGFGTINNGNLQPYQHALLWTDPTDSTVAPIDLSLLLPPELGDFSVANGIDADGTIVGSGGDHAIVWQPTAAAAVPLPPGAEPGLLVLAGVLLVINATSSRPHQVLARPHRFVPAFARS